MKILTNFYFDLIESKSFIGGTKSQQAAFREFIEKEPDCELFGVFTNQSVSGKDFEKTESGRKFFGISIPKFYFRDAFNRQKNGEPREYFPQVFSFFEEVFNKTKPDCVFLNGFPWFASILGYYALEAGLPVIYVHAGLPFKEFNLYRDYLGEEQTDFLLRMDRLITSNSSTVNIFLNNFSKKAYESEFLKLECLNSIIIPLAASFDFKFSAQKENRETDVIKVGLIGRWDRIKNHQAFFLLAKYAAEKRIPMKFLAITQIPEKTKLLGISREEYMEYVEVRDQMPRSELWKFYREADVIVCPSIFDVSPHVVFESLLCGTPALISSGVGHIDLYKDLELSEWVADFSDLPGTIEKINEAASEGVDESVVSHIKEKYSQEAVFKEYIKTINLALSDKNNLKK